MSRCPSAIGLGTHHQLHRFQEGEQSLGNGRISKMGLEVVHVVELNWQVCGTLEDTVGPQKRHRRKVWWV